MARKASPEVQYKLMEVAMGRLEPEERIKWIQNFLKQNGEPQDPDPVLTTINKLTPEQRIRWVKNYLDNFDDKSLLIGGILDCLDMYIEEKFAVKVCNVDGNDMTAKELMEMVAGYGKPTSTMHAIELLREQGFNVVVL